MTAKEYLSGAYLLDQRINSKLEQVQSLRALATKATAHISSERVQTSHNRDTMESVIIKIINLEQDIDADIDRLVDFKRELSALIGEITRPELHLLLELRYLNYKSFEQIAEIMHYSWRQVMNLHPRALQAVEKLESFHSISY